MTQFEGYAECKNTHPIKREEYWDAQTLNWHTQEQFWRFYTDSLEFELPNLVYDDWPNFVNRHILIENFPQMIQNAVQQRKILILLFSAY